MAKSGWTPGDFGRFRMESAFRPRFETIRANKEEGVVVWYHMERSTTAIDPKIFRRDCVNQWVIGNYSPPKREQSTYGWPPASVPDLDHEEKIDDAEVRRRMLQLRPRSRFSFKSQVETPRFPEHSMTGIVGFRVSNNSSEDEALETERHIRGKEFVVRRTQLDHTSCLVDGRLILLPTEYIVRNYRPAPTTVWDHLLD